MGVFEGWMGGIAVIFTIPGLGVVGESSLREC